MWIPWSWRYWTVLIPSARFPASRSIRGTTTTSPGLERLPERRPRGAAHVLARDHVRVDPVVPEAVVVIILGCAGQPSWRRGQTRPSSHTGQCLTPSSGNSSLGPGVNRLNRS